MVLDPELRGQSSLLAECFWEVRALHPGGAFHPWTCMHYNVSCIWRSHWSSAYESDLLRLQVEDSWSPNVRQQFVRFVTGSTHMPHPGMELLRVELPYTAMGREDHRKMLGRLPQVCTCRLQATVKPQAVLALTLHQLCA